MTNTYTYGDPSPCETCPEREDCSRTCAKWRAWFRPRWRWSANGIRVPCGMEPFRSPGGTNDRSSTDLSQRLFETRLLRGLSRKELALMCGILYETYTNYERGSSEPEKATLDVIAEKLGTTWGYLYTGEPVEYDFPNRLRELRQEKGMTQLELGEQCQALPATIGLWERGITFPRSDKLRMLMNIFGVPLADLVGRRA